jgi:hypothetical protein
MKKSYICLLAAFLFIAMTASLVFAQDTDDAKSKSNVRTVTGCLTKGDDANEYLLTSTDGSTWEVRSDKSDLSADLNKTISATGAVSNNKMHNLKEDAKDAAHDTGMKKGNSEHGHMTITDVQMVSDSCQR